MPEWYRWVKLAMAVAWLAWAGALVFLAIWRGRREARPKWDFRREAGSCYGSGFPVAPFPDEAIAEAVRRAREQDESPPATVCEDRL
jgi:hypothetical protein